MLFVCSPLNSNAVHVVDVMKSGLSSRCTSFDLTCLMKRGAYSVGARTVYPASYCSCSVSVFLGLDSDSDDVTSDYDHSQEEAPSFIPVEEHAPFLAVRCPCLDPGKESSWQSFFDPVDSGTYSNFVGEVAQD